MMRRIVLTILLLGTVPTLNTKAQGVCVLDTLRVTVIEGQVKLPNSLPIAGATLELHEKSDDNPVLAMVTSNQEGYFKFDSIKPGKYFIVASSPRLVPLYVPVQVTNKGRGKNRKYIVIMLNGLVTEPCGGGDAELQKCPENNCDGGVR